ncbi:MAG: DUF177 domain-containing protein [Bacteroidales bacterium]|nr:DUF177 domain-containing protein [Bacteroidales bacterium]
MSGLYLIPIGGLKKGYHSFEFEIGNSFFDQFEESEIKEGKLTAVVELVKSASLIEMVVKITGSVKICCDRCLEMFDEPVSCENRLLVKFGKNSDDTDPEIITLPHDEHELDMRQYFYEYIHLALPIKRIHPDDDDGNSRCDPEMLSRLKEHLVDEESRADPRWDELRKLMINN